MTSKELQCIQAADDFRVKYARGLFGKLWAVMCRLKNTWSTQSLPENKTLCSLWNMHGIERKRYGEDRATKLLNQWLDILYSEGTSERLDIKGQCHKKGLRYFKANIPYYENNGDAPHFYFGNPFDNVLEEISQELPPYA